MPINIIPVAFGAHRKATAPPINYQYDIAQILKINGLALPEFYEVDFCNTGDSQTITMIGNAEGVQIPDQFLSTGKPVKAYIVLTESESVQTRYEITIPVSHRPSRSDIEPTPAEQQQIDTLISNLTDASEAATASATAAETAKDRAETAAQSAAASAQAAKDVVIDGEAVIALNGKISIAAPALTKRVASGTQIMNQIWMDRGCFLAGYYLEAATTKMWIYGIFACVNPNAVTFKKYLLYKQNPDFDPYEFTYENAPSKMEVEASGNSNIYKNRTNFTINREPKLIDLRLCMLAYDANGNEIDRIYSDQYRYTASVENNSVTRVKIPTARTSANNIVDVGVYARSISVGETFNDTTTNDLSLYPLVSTMQEVQYSFIIPDSAFSGAAYGLSLVVKTGDGTHYCGPTFHKAENAVTLFSPNGTEFKVTVANDGTLTATAT